MSRSLERELTKEIYDGLKQMGYTFGKQLGSGGFGVTYDCKWTNLENNTEDMAVKYINFGKRYSPKYRPLTLEESEEYRKYRKKLLEEEKNVFRRVLIRFGSTKKKAEITPDLWKRAQGDILRTEIQAMHRTNHPNVVKMMNILQYYDQNKNPNPTHVLIFMEKADSDLHKIQGNGVFTKADAQNYSAQLIRGLAHLHSKGIAHLDMKPKNILVFNVPTFPGGILLKITDFGLSILLPVGAQAKSTGLLGATPRYSDPTVQRIYKALKSGKPGSYPESYDAFKADVWSFGVIVFQLIVGTDETGNVIKSYGGDQKGFSRALISFTQTHSADFVDLLTKVFVDDQSQRLSTLEVCEHNWIRNVLSHQRQSLPSFQT